MDDILELGRGHPEVAFAPGEVLIREGEERPALYLLVSGTVAVWRGTVRVSRTDVPGALFGEMSVLMNSPGSATVAAETEVRAIRIEDGAAFLAERPELALHTARVLAQRLYDATTYLADLKSQFETEAGHLGMVDRILGALMHQQLDRTDAPAPAPSDPRL